MQPGAAGKLVVVVPDATSDWQAEILGQLVGLMSGRLVRETLWQKAAVGGFAASSRVLRLTCLGRLPAVAEANGKPRRPADFSQSSPAEVEIEVTHATGGAQIWVTTPADSTILQLKRTIADRCGDDEDEVVPRMRLMRRWSASTFLPFKDSEPIGTRRKLLAMGVSFAGVPPRLPPRKADRPPTTSATPTEAAGLLAAAMELLEDPGVQQSLAVLDGRAGGVMAAWEPPWEEQGVEDLDAESLSRVPGDTVLGWAKSFADVVALLAERAQMAESPKLY